MSCSDDAPESPDAGGNPNRLVVLDPPGDAIGLTFNEAIELRVRFTRDDESPIAGEVVEFAIMAAGTETVGGATLSGTSATTDRDGVASVGLSAGAQGAGFRVTANASNAPQATFYVMVSDQGFTRLMVQPVHQGPRPEADFEGIEVRLYRPEELTCPAADPDALPPSLFAPRSVNDYEAIAEIPNLASNAGYTVVAWATVPDSDTPISFGCLELTSEQTRNFDVLVSVVTIDRALRMDSSLEVTSVFDLSNVVTASPEVHAAWQTLACPLGPGQLLVDCVADALVSDGTLDCDFQGTGATADAIRAERGTADSSDCRPATKAGGGDSVDKLMFDAIATGGTFPTGAALTSLLGVRDDISTEFRLRSALVISAPTATHRLVDVTVGPGPEQVTVLSDTARPVLEQTQISSDVAPVGSAAPTANLGLHGFTLDLGSIARDGFEALALTPNGLDGNTLGTNLAGSADSGTATACDAVSELVCAAAGQASTCAVASCTTAAGYLDTDLQAWWQLMSVSGTDFTLSGTMVLRDADDDLIVDVIGRDEMDAVTGTWSASVATSSGDVSVAGTVATP